MPIAKVRYCPKAKQDISICYECIGDPKNHPLFLVAGLNCSLLYWPLSFCEKLASLGFHVIRFDNRDVGLSSRLDHLPEESVCSLLCCCNCCVQSPYGLDDMAVDLLELVRLVLRSDEILDAHQPNDEKNEKQLQKNIVIDFSICGMSQGGAISQLAAVIEQTAYFQKQHDTTSNLQKQKVHEQEDTLPVLIVTPKLKSLSLIMTFAEKPPVPRYGIIKVLTSPPVDGSKQALVDWGTTMAKEIFYIKEEWTPEIEKGVIEIFGATHDRIPNDRISSRHRQAVARQSSRIDLLKAHLANVPTIIFHGARDELVPVSFGRQLHKCIPNSKYYEYPTMSHSILPRHYDEILRLVAVNSGLIVAANDERNVVTAKSNEPFATEQTPLIS